MTNISKQEAKRIRLYQRLKAKTLANRELSGKPLKKGDQDKMHKHLALDWIKANMRPVTLRSGDVVHGIPLVEIAEYYEKVQGSYGIDGRERVREMIGRGLLHCLPCSYNIKGSARCGNVIIEGI